MPYLLLYNSGLFVPPFFSFSILSFPNIRICIHCIVVFTLNYQAAYIGILHKDAIKCLIWKISRESWTAGRHRTSVSTQLAGILEINQIAKITKFNKLLMSRWQKTGAWNKLQTRTNRTKIRPSLGRGINTLAVRALQAKLLSELTEG